MNIAILGASRGLGQQLAKISASEGHQLFLSSRSQKGIESANCYNCDFSQPENLEGLIKELVKFKPRAIWYVAGGGPYGEYGSKNWRDHLWAWQVSYLTPANLIHALLRGDLPGCQQFICVGSAIAESAPDALASSYCGAKHALKGLISSLQLELPKESQLDLRLFSPVYMDTNLLPPKAVPRQSGVENLLDPKIVALDFYKWALDSPREWHRIVNK